jgi:hypothetical protein
MVLVSLGLALANSHFLIANCLARKKKEGKISIISQHHTNSSNTQRQKESHDTLYNIWNNQAIIFQMNKQKKKTKQRTEQKYRLKTTRSLRWNLIPIT